MVQPAYLQPGDRIYVVNVARKLNEFPYEALQQLRDWGWEVVIGESLTASPDGQFAATDQVRLTDLQKAIDDEQIRAIFFARGGYGSIRILDQLNWSKFEQSPKWFIGYSDITYFHNSLTSRGFASLHAPMLSDYSDEQAVNRIHSFLTNALVKWETTYEWALRPTPIVEGIATGGNLSIVHTQLGSPSSIHGENAIVFLEDVHENLMVLERMLYNLRRNGVFDRCKAVVFGTLTIPLDNTTSNAMSAEFANVSEQNVESALRAMLSRFFANDEFPVFYGLPFGHEKGKNYPFRLGTKVKIVSGNQRIELQYD